MTASVTDKAVIPLTPRLTIVPLMEVACSVFEVKIGVGEGVGVCVGEGVKVGLDGIVCIGVGVSEAGGVGL